MLERIHPEVKDGWYEMSTPEAAAIGFDKELFYGHFTRDANSVIIHFIYSMKQGMGNVKKLIGDFVSDGWDVVVVNPNEIMQHICELFWLTPAHEVVDDYYDGRPVQCWRRRG